ncbi:MAG: PKD domain-containing protein [Ginsengibacter sp.]
MQGWNAYVHLPWDYYSNPTATYPTIIFFPGLGEVGTTAGLVIKNGPGAYITQGWNGNVKIGVDSVKFIVISLQPDKAWPVELETDKRIQQLKKTYRIDNSRLHLTGLSMGGWASTTYVTGDNYGGPYTYASQIATVVEVEGVRPDDNAPYPQLFDNFANSGGRLLGFEQINDGRDIQTRVDRMNYTRPGSGIFVSTNYGGGGHCCWEQFYGGNGTTPNVFKLDGINQNIYQWMARNPAPVSGPPQNIPPVANAGVDKSITLPSNSVTLTGSGTDADGTIVSYSWAKISGSSGGNIVSPTSATTVVNGLLQGTYQYELTVTDNSGATSKDAVTITVNSIVANIPPVANAGGNITIQLPVSTAVLYGSGSDADGTIVGYSWSKISGPTGGNIVTPNSAATTIYGLIQGTYQYQLTVTDNNGATGQSTMTVTVKGTTTNIPPTADAGPSVTIQLPVNTVTVYGSGTDSDGTIVAYLWTKTEGPSCNMTNITSPTLLVNNLVAGVYHFQLAVTDNSGATAINAMGVTVLAGTGNVSPVANAGTDITIVSPASTTTLYGSGTDSDGTISSYSWTQISGASAKITSSKSASTTITGLNTVGSYIFRLTVTDNLGATSYNDVTVTVAAAGNISPVANAGADITITSPASTTTLYGSGTDADGSISSYSWTQISGASAKIVSSKNATTSITGLNSVGSYIFRLTVTDNGGATGFDDVTVTVAGATNVSGKRKMIPIAPDGGIYFINHGYLQPGDTGCIASGTYPYISLDGVVGTASLPITITNCGGQVINTGNNGTSYCYRIVNSRFFKFTGTGTAGVNYGFKAYWKGGFTGAGMSVRDSSSDYEIDHLEAQNVQNGFLCKIDPYDCDPASWSTGWTINNISFHDNYVHNTSGEGYYIINTSSTVTVKDCSGNYITVEPVKANGVKVYNNICDSTGWDGIQVAASTNAQIYNNKVTNYGLYNLSSQQAGILLGGKSDGSIYNNYVSNGTGEGLEIFGTNRIYVYNNVVTNAGWDGTSVRQDAIAIDDRPQPYNFYGGLQVYVLNNTVVNAGRNAVHIFNSYGTMATGNKINNNLLVKPNNTSPYDNPYANIDGNTVVDTSKNVRLSVISVANFVNSVAGDYHLQSTSPAIDKGLDASGFGVTFDYDYISRPQGKFYDAGAFEYYTGSQPPPPVNQPPVANAGSNLVIQQPLSQVFLDGGQSNDPDGTIVSYKWSLVSGPSGSTFKTSTKDTTTLVLTNAGTYTVRLTVTDNGGLSASNDITITLSAGTPPANVPPVANAGYDQVVQQPVSQVFLDGRQSTDPDGTIKSYKWTLVSGPSGSTFRTSTKDTTTFSLVNTGIYTISLTVTDNGGLSTSTTITVTLQAAVVVPPPIVNLGGVIHVNIYDGKTPFNNSQWNNWNVNSSLTSNKFSYDDGSSSSVSAYLTASQRVIDNGSNYASSATSCPSQVLQLNSISTSDRTLTINGLDPTKLYRIELYASRANSTEDTRFVIGNAADTISILDNADDYAKFDNVSPVNTHIDVDIERINTWQYIAGFSIIEQGANLGSYSLKAPSTVTDGDATIKSPASNDASLKTNFILLSNNTLTIKLNSSQQQKMQLNVTDASGRTYLKTNVSLQKGYNTFSKFVPGISKGIYYIKLLTNDNFIVKPLLNSGK